MINGVNKRPKTSLRSVDRGVAYRTIAKRLRWLMDFERSAEFSIKRWEWEGRKLYAFMTKRGLEMDEHYWHYMSDVDIRQRETEAQYAEIQRDGIQAIIEELESGQYPSDA